MIVPDKAQFLRQAEEGTLIPVFREFHADLETPVSAYMKISARFPTDHFLLESVEGGKSGPGTPSSDSTRISGFAPTRRESRSDREGRRGTFPSPGIHSKRSRGS